MRRILLLLTFLVLHVSTGTMAFERNTDICSYQPSEKILPTDSMVVDVTIYHPVMEQCDSTPLITASNKHIDTVKLKQGKIRWVAMSRDMLQYWGGDFNYGDTVIIKSGDEHIDGEWVVQDTMNSRYKSRIDLLYHQSTRKLGLWKNVVITKKRKRTAYVVPLQIYCRKYALKQNLT